MWTKFYRRATQIPGDGNQVDEDEFATAHIVVVLQQIVGDFRCTLIPHDHELRKCLLYKVLESFVLVHAFQHLLVDQLTIIGLLLTFADLFADVLDDCHRGSTDCGVCISSPSQQLPGNVFVVV